jgi:hypothetical protein
VIGRIFHALGLVEQWGSGIQRMVAATREAGLAPPMFEELATRLRVTIATARVGRPVLDETDQASLAGFAGGRGRLPHAGADLPRLRRGGAPDLPGLRPSLCELSPSPLPGL